MALLKKKKKNLVIVIQVDRYIDFCFYQEQAIEGQSEQESEPKTNPRHALNCPPATSRRSRQNLTEEEKEQRRLSRVLANRESARQTIRRRQAMYEELTRKAADLASENESLKKKKEMAAKEYDSLKNQNASLRLQVISFFIIEGDVSLT
ncbi:transcription factor HBP-1a-like [Capsicum annuum]|uniref:transcription factor HBP-1a-like n=1 Tax=Capsicum annuum TaxID=4072 RepID=UPI001FB10C02|nr:transcription factor HBP-1a-like [Capsicum annuum]